VLSTLIELAVTSKLVIPDPIEPPAVALAAVMKPGITLKIKIGKRNSATTLLPRVRWQEVATLVLFVINQSLIGAHEDK
jgi:hypothetical protein